MRLKELSVERQNRIVSSHRSGEWYQNIYAALMVPKSTVASIILKLTFLAQAFASGTPQQHSAEKAMHEIQKYLLDICNFHTLTSPIQQMNDKHLVNLPIVSDFKKALQPKHNI